MNNSQFAFLAVLILFFTSPIGCASSGLGGDFSVARSHHSTLQDPDRYIIKSADMKIEVSEPSTTAEEIKEIVKREEGVIANTNDRNHETVRLTVKVPEAKLESFLEEVTSLGKLISKSIHAKDVTEEVVDIEAKQKNLLTLRDRLRALLNKAEKVGEIIEIERELSRVQTELDSIEGRWKKLKNQVAYSRVHIVIDQETIYGPLGYVGHGIYWVISKLFVIK